MTMGINEPALLHEILQEYIQSLHELLRCLRDSDLTHDQLYIEVHKLKSSSAAVGALLLAEKLKQAEQLLLQRSDSPALTAALDHLCLQTIAVISAHIDAKAGH